MPMLSPLPHPSSRAAIVEELLGLFPARVDRLLEPFVGSGALTLAAAQQDLANYFVVGDELEALVAIWQLMIERPSVLCDGVAAARRGSPPADGPVRLLFDVTQGVEQGTLDRGLEQAHELLRGRAGTLAGDYSLLMRAAQPEDLVYLDPPPVGGPSAWHPDWDEGLDADRFRDVLDAAIQRNIRFVVTTDLDLGLRKQVIGGVTVWLSY